MDFQKKSQKIEKNHENLDPEKKNFDKKFKNLFFAKMPEKAQKTRFWGF